MSAKKISSRSIARDKYTVYFKKAQDFYLTMQTALGNKNWNSVGLEAVHCVISSADAILAFHSGIRCTSQDHREVASLLRSEIKTPETIQNVKHLLKVINMKNLIEYEARNFREKEAREIVKHTERFFNWVKSIFS